MERAPASEDAPRAEVDEAASVETEQQAEVPRGATEAATDSHRDRWHFDLVSDVPLRLTVEIGGAEMLVREVLQLGAGSVVELDRLAGEPADVLINGRLVARGELTVVEERLAVRVVEVVGRDRSDPQLG